MAAVASIWETQNRPKTRAEKIIHWTGIALVSLLIAAGAGVFIYLRWDFDDSWPEPGEGLSGSFRLAKGEHRAAWQAMPTTCVDGKERGFEGIAFEFSTGAVTAVRIDTSRAGDNTVEVHFADPGRPPVIAREGDCNRIDGSIRRSNYVLNGRHMYRLTGTIRADCPKQGITGHATFDGCLPMSPADLH